MAEFWFIPEDKLDWPEYLTLGPHANMSNPQPQFAKLADGSGIMVTQRVWMALTCPKCRKDMDVTDVSFGAVIQCPHCENITWRPEFKPRWYFRVRNFIFANLLSFIVGVLASLLASYIYEHQTKAGATAQNAALNSEKR